MVIVTKAAKQKLKRLLSSANVDDPELGLRLLLIKSGQFDLMLDKEKAGDQVVKHTGSKVLLVGEDLSEGLDGTIIDCKDSGVGCRLVLLKQ